MTNQPSAGAPSFRSLAHSDAEALLARNHVGRIAFTFHDRVDIEPVHYVYADGWIYGRTSPGTKLSTIAHNRWVAFEVDESTGLFDWSSVVVKGGVELVTNEAGAHEHVYHHAVALLRTLSPFALTENDPAPNRSVIFRIHLDEVHGRQATSSAES